MRRPLRRRARLSAIRPAARSGHRKPSRRRESPAAPATRVAGRRCRELERKIEADPRSLDEAGNLGNQCLILAVGANQLRFRKAILEIVAPARQLLSKFTAK